MYFNIIKNGKDTEGETVKEYFLFPKKNGSMCGLKGLNCFDIILV